MKSGPCFCSAFGGGESNAEGKELIEMEKQRVWRDTSSLEFIYSTQAREAAYVRLGWFQATGVQGGTVTGY